MGIVSADKGHGLVSARGSNFLCQVQGWSQGEESTCLFRGRGNTRKETLISKRMSERRVVELIRLTLLLARHRCVIPKDRTEHCCLENRCYRDALFN